MGQSASCHRQDPGELFPRVGFIVTNLPMDPDWVLRFYNQRGTAEQHIKEGKYAFRWTRLSCKKFRDNEVRLQLHALAYNLVAFLRCIDLPEAMADWSLTSLQLEATLRQKVRYILVGQRVAQIHPYGAQDDHRREAVAFERLFA